MTENEKEYYLMILEALIGDQGLHVVRTYGGGRIYCKDIIIARAEKGVLYIIPQHILTITNRWIDMPDDEAISFFWKYIQQKDKRFDGFKKIIIVGKTKNKNKVITLF